MEMEYKTHIDVINSGKHQDQDHYGQTISYQNVANHSFSGRPYNLGNTKVTKGNTLVTKMKTSETEGKTLVTKVRTLVLKGATVVIKMKTLVTKGTTVVIKDLGDRST